jgi:hypothetical protein
MTTGKHSENVEFFVETGGYFGLDLPYHGDPFPDAYKFQSGRAALRAVLECAGIKRVMVPAYICGSVIQAIADSGAVAEPYLLDDSLYPKDLPDVLSDQCVLLCVNYFGLCQENINRLLKEYPGNKLIIDNSQALFAPPPTALATIYSPRKYLGVPDGGLATSDLDIKVPESEDMESIGRMRHLLLRMAYSAREGYSGYLESENSLNNTIPLGMSRLTRRLLASIDMGPIKRRRRENFLALAARLDKYNIHKWVLDDDSVPLCYPLVVDRDVDRLKNRLVEKGIFIPAYWPDAKARVPHNSVEHRFMHRCLAVPCDQRYSVGQMSDLADEILSGLENRELS